MANNTHVATETSHPTIIHQLPRQNISFGRHISICHFPKKVS